MVAVRLDFAQVRRTLPHGPGMVLLDRVEELVPGVRLCAVKTVSGGEPCYAGLSPASGGAAYAYPVSLLIESFGQAAAVLWLHSAAASQRDQVLMLAGVRDCTFVASAYPGDVLRHVVELEHRSDGAAFVTGHTAVGPRRIASYGSLTAVVRPRAALPVRAGAALSTTDREEEGRP